MKYLSNKGYLNGTTRFDLSIIMDNFSVQNKNNYVLRLPAYLTMNKYFEKVQIVFLVDGHTKNTADRLFNLLKIDYRKENVFSLSKLIKVCNQNEYELEAIKKCQIFEAGNEPIGMIECYESHLDDVVAVQDFLLKLDLPSQIPGEPNRLYKEQKGIGDIKAVGLYENFHGLIDEKYHDEICPK